MKTPPCLLLTSFCVLLCHATPAEAQQPQPRFGYGSVSRGAYVIPAPKKPAAPAAKAQAAPAKPKPAAAKPTAGPPVAKAAKRKPGDLKSTPGKSTANKAVASSKSGPKATGAPPRSAPKPQVAKTPSKPSRESQAPSKAIAVSGKTKASTRTKPEHAPDRGVPSTVLAATGSPGRKPSLAPLPSPVTGTISSTAPVLADLSGTSPVRGFHFFGSPVVLPVLPAMTAPDPGPSPRSGPVVDLIAARHSLGRSHTTPTPRAASGASAALPPEVSGAVPGIAPTLLDAEANQLSQTPLPVPSGSSHDFDDVSSTRSIPGSLTMGSIAAVAEAIPESTALDEPALPAALVASDGTSSSPAPTELEPALPADLPPPPVAATPETAQTSVAASGKEEEPARGESPDAGEDLSERERAFVRSLAEAAGSVTSGDGQLNQDLPASIATAATALVDQIPAETVATFRSAAATAKSAVRGMVPELPMEISNDLMPATPEKMPDQLPTFHAPASGKIDVQSDRQADYDQANNKVIFTGKVEMNSAVIRLRADRVEVFMKKGGGGMDHLEATGNVLMRTRDNENGPGQMASAGRASYNLKTGEITLSDWPKIQETGKSHISTDPSTRMYMFTDGRLRTDGPNRTILGGN